MMNSRKHPVTCALCIRLGTMGETFEASDPRSDLVNHMRNAHWFGSNEIAEVLADSCFYACAPDLSPLDREGEDLLLALRRTASGSGVDAVDVFLDLKTRRESLRKKLHRLRKARGSAPRPVGDELDTIVEGLANALDELGTDPEPVESD